MKNQSEIEQLMKSSGYDMLYLSFCALNDVKPDENRVEKIDLSLLYKMAEFHSMSAIVAMSLEQAGIYQDDWQQAKLKAIRKNILLDDQRRQILAFMEEEKIWYMPLKGVVLKAMYPKPGMRQMADNDILFDKQFRGQLAEFMFKNGYSSKSSGKGHHDEYLKKPVYNFEMHTSLYAENQNKEWAKYYKDVKSRLIKDEGNLYGYHFSDEDFYVYMITHGLKHYDKGGVGLRSLADVFVFLKEKEASMNWAYVNSQLEKLKIIDFEKKTRSLSKKIFSKGGSNKLHKDEREMLEYVLLSGTFGTMTNLVEKNFKSANTTKFKYLCKRLFPDREFFEKYYDVDYKNKLSIFAAWMRRLLNSFTVNRKRVKNEISAVAKLDKDEK